MNNKRRESIIDVLDHGYVRLVDKMGDDTTIVNAARVSYDKQTDELRPQDERLLNFLAREGHTSPFRHAMLQFEIYAPLMVARQHWKHVIGSAYTKQSHDGLDAWNESSRRYVTEEPQFYIPRADQWRTAPDNMKQGSGDLVKYENEDLAESSSYHLAELIETSVQLYEGALKYGIAAEQARLFLPANAMYVRFYWTVSLQAVIHFLQLREAPDAQFEIREYANAIDKHVRESFPAAYKAFRGGGRDEDN